MEQEERQNKARQGQERPNFLGGEAPGKTMAAPKFSLEASEAQMEPDLHDCADHPIQVDNNLGPTRFRGTFNMGKIRDGSKTFRLGMRGITVYKLQQALYELGYLAKHHLSGTFTQETRAAVLAFDEAKQMPRDGEFDTATLSALESSYKDRSVYRDAAQKLPHDAPTAISPRLGNYINRMLSGKANGKPSGSPTIFKETIVHNGHQLSYEQALIDRMKGKLRKHYSSYRKNRKLRRKAENMYNWSEIEGPMAVSIQAVRQLYGNWDTGQQPAKTHANGKLRDQWKKVGRVRRNGSTESKKKYAKGLLEGWMVGTSFRNLHRTFGANPSRAREKTILADAIDKLLSTELQVEKVLKAFQNWEGTHQNGVVSLQRVKAGIGYSAEAKEKNRREMYRKFYVGIHEYIHSCAHPNFQTYAHGYRQSNRIKADTLNEGFCDFFCKNVNANLRVTPEMKRKIEGNYADPDKPFLTAADVDVPYYGVSEEAERVIGVIGLANAHAAFFKGQVEFLTGGQ